MSERHRRLEQLLDEELAGAVTAGRRARLRDARDRLTRWAAARRETERLRATLPRFSRKVRR